jgi:hypothetical protein
MAFNIFRVAEPVAAFSNPDCPNLSCLFIDILKQMFMDGSEMIKVQTAIG